MRIFRAPSGDRSGVIVTMQEVTELKRAISDLSRLSRAQEMAEEIGGSGHAILDLTNELVHYSTGARSLLGLSAAQTVPLSAALELFGPESEKTAAEAMALMKAGLDIPFTAVRELPRHDGTTLRVRMNVQGRNDPVTRDRLVFAVFQQVP